MQYSEMLLKDLAQGADSVARDIRENPGLALAAIHHIFSQSLWAEARGETKKARGLYRAAGEVASRSSGITGQGKYTRLYEQLSRWERWQKRLKITADGFFAQGLEQFKNNHSLAYAISRFRQAEVLYQKINDQTSLARTYAHMGRAFFWSRKLKEALDAYQKSLVIAQASGDALGEQMALSGLSSLTPSCIDADTSISYGRRAVDINQQLKYETGLLTALLWLSNGYLCKADFNQALGASKQMLALKDRILDPQLFSELYFYTGYLYAHFGDYTTALNYFHQALNVPIRPELKSFVLNGMGEIYCYNFEEFDRCLDYSKRALTASTASGFDKGRVYSLCNVGYAEFKLGNHASALDHLQRAYAIADGQRMNDLACHSLYLIGRINLTRSKLAESLSNFETALFKLEQASMQNTGIAIMNAIGMGDTYKGLGDVKKACATYLKVIDTIEQRRATIGPDTLRRHYLADLLNPYFGLVELLAKSGDPRQSFLYNERIKARTLFEAITRRADDTRGTDPSLLLSLRQRLGEINRRLSLEEIKQTRDPVKINDLKNELKRERLVLEEYLEKVAVETHGVRPVPDVSNYLSQDQLGRAFGVGDRVAIVSYCVLPKLLLAWVIRKDAIYLEKIDLSSEDLRSYISRLRQPLEDFKAGRVQLRGLTFDAQLAHALYLRIFAPLEKYIGRDDHLIIIPNDVLFYFPFEALVTDLQPGNRESYLIERHGISYAPSVAALAYVLKSKRAAKRSLLAMGNPDYGQTSNITLPTSEHEVRSISAHFSHSNVYMGKLANEAVFKSEAPKYGIIHLSAHAIVDDTNPLFSRIEIGASAQPFEDGYVETQEIMDLKLDAELVTLSACESGTGALLKGEGILSLSNAFFIAGAASVISTLWPIEDRAATETMKLFYRALMQDGLGKAQALRKAKLQLINAFGPGSEILSHPLVWGSFTLMGDYR